MCRSEEHGASRRTGSYPPGTQENFVTARGSEPSRRNTRTELVSNRDPGRYDQTLVARRLFLEWSGSLACRQPQPAGAAQGEAATCKCGKIKLAKATDVPAGAAQRSRTRSFGCTSRRCVLSTEAASRIQCVTRPFPMLEGDGTVCGAGKREASTSLTGFSLASGCDPAAGSRACETRSKRSTCGFGPASPPTSDARLGSPTGCSSCSKTFNRTLSTSARGTNWFKRECSGLFGYCRSQGSVPSLVSQVRVRGVVRVKGCYRCVQMLAIGPGGHGGMICRLRGRRLECLENHGNPDACPRLVSRGSQKLKSCRDGGGGSQVDVVVQKDRHVSPRTNIMAS